MRAVKITYSDGTEVVTNINGTDEEIRKYFRIGKPFNLGTSAPDIQEDNVQRVTSIEFID